MNRYSPAVFGQPGKSGVRAAMFCMLIIMSLESTGAPASPDAALRQAILAAEHNRAGTEADLAVLTEAVKNRNPEIQRLAARALGRLERPEIAPLILPLLAAADPLVRRDAATAYGRALTTAQAQAASAGERLRARLAAEQDGEVRAALCEVIGRLPYQDAASVHEAEGALSAAAGSDEAVPARAVSLLGAVRGLESLIRLRGKLSPPVAGTIQRLQELSVSSKEAAIRRLAMTALAASGKLDAASLALRMDDSDAQVRRLAVRGAASLPPADSGADEVIARALQDPTAMVRYDALAAYSRRHRAGNCGTLLAFLKDGSPHVVLEAVDLLAGGCASDDAAIAALSRMADALPAAAAARGWHEPAHAIVALAKIAPDAARPRLASFAGHPQWQVRVYAARAAATVAEGRLLETLVRDPDGNVRNAALGGLVAIRRHQADAFCLEALAARDYQLVLTAARALAGTPDRAAAVPALLASLARLTAERRDTSRDPRAAILQRLRELGSAANAASLKPYLADFDPRVATLAAESLTTWTGERHVVATHALDPGPVPKYGEVEPLRNATALVTMRPGGSFELRLLGDEAPATVLRFVRLARAGYYNGLTFHRVEPNFVIQGGSPGANEYMGDARYMRDELGRLTHARGTVGISTRGRDTGDAQIFINLVDNPRLDMDYTVFAEVVRGIEVIDGILEGDVIERIEIRTSSRK